MQAMHAAMLMNQMSVISGGGPLFCQEQTFFQSAQRVRFGPILLKKSANRSACFVVFLIIVDQSWNRGHYTDQVARTLSRWVR